MDKEQLTTLTGVIDKRMNRQLKQYLDICARCAICKDACHQYVGTGDFKYLPARRAELIRQVYKKYFDKAGKFVPALYEARDPDENLLDELYESTYACTGCRRCMYYCPFSIDTQWILSVAKAILIAAGRGNEMLGQLADAAMFKAENFALFRDVIVNGFKDIEKDVQEITGDPTAEIPVDKQGADILYVALAGAHSIRPAAVIFHEAKASWTLSMFESANYGFFFGDPVKARQIADRFMDEAYRLGVKEVVITECGHAYRVAEIFHEAWSGKKHPFKVRHILEVIDEYIKDGRITVDKGLIEGRVTYHDPCQIGRNGGIFEQPRDIVKA
ncbi:(Fe-S)-binding protein, partial [bacterium]|nr:(Fe-S)-binding protein [bacterium]